jgi:N-acetylglucosamine malate deacetylase 1
LYSSQLPVNLGCFEKLAELCTTKFNDMKLDLLAFAAHPDDAELACSGTLIAHIHQGYKVGVADLTRGELGTRGTPEIRAEEAKRAGEILGLHARVNLDLGDGFLDESSEKLTAVIRIIRLFRPEIVLANAIMDRHPDHSRASSLVSRACFLSGLHRIETKTEDGMIQNEWRPGAVYHYIQDRHIRPDLIVDISPFMDQRMEAIRSYSSQFFDPESVEPSTAISSRQFMEIVRLRAVEWGRVIGVEYGEGFTVERPAGTRSLFSLI